jgi:hypothetical protein
VITGSAAAQAATIMFCVFAAFAGGGMRPVAEFGLGLAVAVVFDAFLLHLGDHARNRGRGERLRRRGGPGDHPPAGTRRDHYQVIVGRFTNNDKNANHMANQY